MQLLGLQLQLGTDTLAADIEDGGLRVLLDTADDVVLKVSYSRRVGPHVQQLGSSQTEPRETPH